MANLLSTDTLGLDKYAEKASRIYPIASRCGVFAKTDIQPLLNEGAQKSDVAASIMQAVVSQTLGGLAAGKPVCGNIAFLGGPLHFLPQLRHRFIETLKLTPEQALVPPNAQYFVSMGAAMICEENGAKPIELSEMPDLSTAEVEKNPRLPPLFRSEEDLKQFRARHAENSVSRVSLDSLWDGLEDVDDAPVIRLFIGIDAGSTTTKVAVIDEECRIVWNHYGSNGGSPLKSTMDALARFYTELHVHQSLHTRSVIVSSCCVTGYGERLVKSALECDYGVVETVAHTTAADFFMPGVEFVLDIGGIDIKCISVEKDELKVTKTDVQKQEKPLKPSVIASTGSFDSVDIEDIAGSDTPSILPRRKRRGLISESRGEGEEEDEGKEEKRQTGSDLESEKKPTSINSSLSRPITNVILNESCSSGCGSFISQFSSTLGLDVKEFAKLGLLAPGPVDLGSRCTIFMNSRVKQSQKEGATVSEISAGIAISVIKNALYKVIRVRDVRSLGDKIVCQGGTFLNECVLRAFEQLVGVNVVRPDIAGLMGAFGCALIGRQRRIEELNEKKLMYEDTIRSAIADGEDESAVLCEELRARIAKEKNTPSSMFGLSKISALTWTTSTSRCCGCGNKCLLTESRFSNGKVYVSGNRCERGAEGVDKVREKVKEEGRKRILALKEKKKVETERLKLQQAAKDDMADKEKKKYEKNQAKVHRKQEKQGAKLSIVDRLLEDPSASSMSLSHHMTHRRLIKENYLPTAETCVPSSFKPPANTDLPNMFSWKNKRLFSYKPLSKSDASRGEIGLPRALNVFEDYPFWFTLFTCLGFRVILSPPSRRETYERGMHTISSDLVCYPAKLVHGHVLKLVDMGIKNIFYPLIPYNRECRSCGSTPSSADHAANQSVFACPIVATYPLSIQFGVKDLQNGDVKFHHPVLPLDMPNHLILRLSQELPSMCEGGISKKEIKDAVQVALLEHERWKRDLKEEGERVVEWMSQWRRRSQSGRGIVVCSRPYHIDGEINHGIPELLQGHGLVVLTDDCVAHLGPEEVVEEVVEEWTKNIGKEEKKRSKVMKKREKVLQKSMIKLEKEKKREEKKMEKEKKKELKMQKKKEKKDISGAPEDIEEEEVPAVDTRAEAIIGGGYSHDTLPLPPCLPHSDTVDQKKLHLRVRSQWTYHHRMYRAAAWAIGRDDVEVLQLVSFGCGVDAVTSDQINELVKRGKRIFTLTKIDEMSNLGAVRIRVRSLLAAVEAGEREKRQKAMERIKAGLDPIPQSLEITPFVPPKQAIFGVEDRKRTILAPQMSFPHFQFLPAVFKPFGYNLEVLDHADYKLSDIVNEGLNSVHSDACYPAILVVGQLIHAIRSGRYKPEEVALGISQTNGACRASNYLAFIKRALHDLGLLDKIPVITLSFLGIKTQPGFSITLPIIRRLLISMLAGDVLDRLRRRTRPYETEESLGESERLFAEMSEKFKEALLLKTLTKNAFNKLVDESFDKFEAISIHTHFRKPRVGIVGEILVKYEHTANNQVVAFLEKEGAEVVVPDLLDFFLYCGQHIVNGKEIFGEGGAVLLGGKLVVSYSEAFRKHYRQRLARSPLFKLYPASLPEPKPLFPSPSGHIPTHERLSNIVEISKLAEGIDPSMYGCIAGEGWLLSGEIRELLEERGCNSVIVVSPWACLPNHVVGRACMEAVKDMHPLANVTAIDYDPALSEINQISRLKLMMSTAFRLHRRQGLAANLEEAEERVREGGLRERERVCGFVLDDQCEEREKEEEEKGEDDCSIITSAHSTLPSPCASLPDSEKVSPVGSSKGSEEEESVGEEKEVQGVVALQEDSS
eukprot:gnl/Carplike_NY0171/183_a270_1781.p1 GENE.gnl/Carplike_NY0171/183_a270_1781~~gnl/Carplike_NY0171/183_a270_1781.p1  ORF type:complete len:1963 (+),score=582.65 gnl/Carplike_NY0171/183_a270_1781:424-5889(+)